MNYQTLKITKNSSTIFTLILNRPTVHNAFDETLISEMTQALEQLSQEKNLRVLLITGEGKSFSAGADLNMMQRMANFTEAENLADAKKLANLMNLLYNFPIPTIALVNGATYGGGVGLVACCDIALANESAKFCLSEVKLGLIPAVISPYVIAAIGQRQAQRYFLTAEVFDAQQAKNIQLIHDICKDNLDSVGLSIAQEISKNGPNAIKEAKKSILALSPFLQDKNLIEQTASKIAELRTSSEGQEGIQAFLAKRSPNWI